jgi:two-component system, sensor histidine kinase and response regulator
MKTATGHDFSSARGDELFDQHRQQIYVRTDRLFARLMIAQWVAGIAAALFIAPRTWSGQTSHIHIHVWGAIFIGAAISAFPLWMIRTSPGAAVTRHVIAVAQMLMSALLIDLTGGRIETHFHVFGSLVILSFYRDWKVLIPATIVVALDHFFRGVYWPYSVYGVLTASPWRSIEHAGWVIFEDVFLVISCLRSIREMRSIANRTAALEASEQNSRQIFEDAPIGMAVVGLDERFSRTNAAFRDMIGYSEEELAERTPLDITYPGDLALSRQLAEAMLNGAGRSCFEKRYVCKDGEVRWATRTGCIIRDGAGQPQHFLIMVEDISDRKAAEEALCENRRELEAALKANQLIMDNSLDVICTIDEADRFTTVNAACIQLWGYTPEELIGRPYVDFVYPEDRAKTEEAAHSIRLTGHMTDFVNRYVRKDGTIVDVLWAATWSEVDKKHFCVAHNVTERARIEKALREAKEDADRANCAKSDFLSRMSHELRTPLNAILGFGQLLETQSPTEMQRTRVQHIIAAGRHLLDLINEILDISRIEAGRLQLSIEPVCVADAVREAFDLMRPSAMEHETTLSVPARPDESIYVMADRQRFKQVLLNLLTNAVKYTPCGGKVTISFELSASDSARIIVTDTGPGIPSEKIARLFTPFDRLGAEQSAVEGTGLGLALSQRLIHAMRGLIGVDSTPGQGSTFWVELPRAKSPLERVASKNGTGAERPLSNGERTITILYVEDNLSNLTLVEQMLADQPRVTLITAMQGRLGLELARQHAPDLILLDLHLPDMGGPEVLSELQRHDSTRDIPVVVISADATTRQIKRLLGAGARAYLTKPIDVAEFFRVVEGNAFGKGSGEIAVAVSRNGNGQIPQA